MGWSWAAACGVQGRGHIAPLPAQLVMPSRFGSKLTFQISSLIHSKLKLLKINLVLKKPH